MVSLLESLLPSWANPAHEVFDSFGWDVISAVSAAILTLSGGLMFYMTDRRVAEN